jgi:hypothetical protein
LRIEDYPLWLLTFRWEIDATSLMAVEELISFFECFEGHLAVMSYLDLTRVKELLRIRLAYFEMLHGFLTVEANSIIEAKVSVCIGIESHIILRTCPFLSLTNCNVLMPFAYSNTRLALVDKAFTPKAKPFGIWSNIGFIPHHFFRVLVEGASLGKSAMIWVPQVPSDFYHFALVDEFNLRTADQLLLEKIFSGGLAHSVIHDIRIYVVETITKISSVVIKGRPFKKYPTVTRMSVVIVAGIVFFLGMKLCEALRLQYT